MLLQSSGRMAREPLIVTPSLLNLCGLLHPHNKDQEIVVRLAIKGAPLPSNTGAFSLLLCLHMDGDFS